MIKNNKTFFNIILFWIVSVTLILRIIPLFVGRVILNNLSIIGLKPLNNNDYQSYIIIAIIMFVVLVILNKYWLKQKVFYLSNVPLKKQFLVDMFIIISLIGLLYNIFNVKFEFNNGFYIKLITNIEAGVFEEYLMRGIILIALIKCFINFKKNSAYKAINLAVIISSLMFALTHLLNAFGPTFSSANSENIIEAIIQVIYALFLGIILSVIYLSTRSIIWAMLCHFCFDFSSDFIKNSLTYINSLNSLIIYICSFAIISFLLLFLCIRPNNAKNICNYFYIHIQYKKGHL